MKRKLLIQVIAAMVLFVIISVVLEKEYTTEVILQKSQTAVLFGVVYALILWANQKFRNRKP